MHVAYVHTHTHTTHTPESDPVTSHPSTVKFPAPSRPLFPTGPPQEPPGESSHSALAPTPVLRLLQQPE